MDDYAGRVLADRYRLPLPPSDAYEFAESRAFDTYSGQEVLVRQVPLPEVVEAEVLEDDGSPAGPAGRPSAGRATRRPANPAVRRAIEAAQAAAQIPDHPRLDQVFDVFAEDGSLWIVSEVVAALPLAALIAERPLTPYRAAEVASDVLTALRALHANGWVHRNITTRTVLVCDDGRVMLTGLAAGAAEEALCGYDPVPEPAGSFEPGESEGAGETGGISGTEEFGARRGTEEFGARGGTEEFGARGGAEADDPRAARAGAIAAYQAGARAAAAARMSEEREEREGYGREVAPAPAPDSAAEAVGPPGRIADPYGVGGAPYGSGRPGGGTLGWSGGARHLSEQPSAAVERDARRDAAWHGAAPRAGVAGASADADAGTTGQLLPYPEGFEPRDQHQDQDQYRGRDQYQDPLQYTEASPQDAQDPYVPPSREAVEWTSPYSDLIRPHETDRHATGSGAGEGDSGGAAVNPPSTTGRWDELVAASEVPRPQKRALTPLDAERARQARMTVVGAVTERWSPEQAGPVHQNWQLAAPVGPATDLWALGALLFRAVQGHAPYPEESTYELVQMVCAEPPAFAEECGPLRPVVESLLRQDPTERPDFEELRGWLRSLVRSAPEPEAGADLVPTADFDASRLPVVRRRGELVRRRRAARQAEKAAARGRHKRGQAQQARGSGVSEAALGAVGTDRPDRTAAAAPAPAPAKERRREKPPRPPRPPREPRPPRTPRELRQPRQRGSRKLGRTLLTLILLGVVGAVAYAMVFMPKAGPGEGAESPGGQAGSASSAPAQPGGGPSDDGGRGEADGPDDRPGGTGGSGGSDGSDDGNASHSQKPEPPRPTGPEPADGFALRKDPEGFQVAVASGFDRAGKNGRGQVTYTRGEFSLVVVPGRDSAKTYGSDPLKYQREYERELQPFRDSSWATSSGLREINVGGRVMAEGQFTWQDTDGDEVYVRNLAMLLDGRYHVVMVKGPESDRDEVTRLYEQASGTYRPGG